MRSHSLISVTSRISRRFSPNTSEILSMLLFSLLPMIIENFSGAQMASDILLTLAKPEYLLNVAEEWDYVIIGGGSSGSVVANRLSAKKENKVLLLESGGDPNPFTEIPALYWFNLAQDSLVVRHETVPRTDLCLPNQLMLRPKCGMLAGKGLGGSSNVNGMIYARGSRHDFNEWARVSGDPGWKYENVLPFFQKSEDYHGFYQPTDRKYHGTGGELYVGTQGHAPVLQRFFRAAEEMGLKSFDMNVNHTKGYTKGDVTLKNGSRWGTYQAFLRPVLRRVNLNIYRYAEAVKIHLDRTGRAIGVTYVRHGKSRYVKATKEVILSAGAIGSPKLLMLSGIGPKPDLTALGIKPLVDLPVGKMLQDHITTFLQYNINESLTFVPRRDMTLTDFQEYVLYRKGPFARLGFNGHTYALTTSSTEVDESWPDLELIFFGGAIQSKQVTRDQFVVQIVLIRPKSTGELRLASKDPSVSPKIDPKYLSDPSDLTRLVDGILYALKMFESTEAFKSLKAELVPIHPVPGCGGHVPRSREYWACYVRRGGISASHQIGTVRIGTGLSDPDAVVDSKLQILKCRGLRVVDNSIIPSGGLTGHPNADAILIGELGSTFILQEGRRRRSSGPNNTSKH